jgi:hypothetical protein
MSNLTGAAGNAFVGGGISPQEAALTQYNFGEHALGGASRFGGSGLGMSTNETMAGAVGPTVGEVEQAASLSDQLSNAQAQFANAQQAGAKGLTGQATGLASQIKGNLTS